MRSEHKQSNKVQIRIGRITHESYLFFSRELGDLILEPGDEITLVARERRFDKYVVDPQTLKDDISFNNRKGVFNKIRKYLITHEAIHRLSNRAFNSFDCLKEAITKYKR